MNFKNDGLTVGELSIAIATIIVIGFIWTNLTKEKANKEVTLLMNDSGKISYLKM